MTKEDYLDFTLDLSLKLKALGLSEDKQKEVADIVFWAMELAATPNAKA